jgi:hypothetical protein
MNGTVSWQSVTSCAQAAMFGCSQALSQVPSISVGGDLTSIWNGIFEAFTANLKSLEFVNGVCSSGRLQPIIISIGLTVRHRKWRDHCPAHGASQHGRDNSWLRCMSFGFANELFINGD